MRPRRGAPSTRTTLPMPELPEVEVTRLSFAERIRGARVTAVRVGKPLRWPLGVSHETLVGRRVGEVSRRGKYLWVALDRGGLLMHLGMSGSLSFGAPTGEPGPHDHFDLVTARGTLRLDYPTLESLMIRNQRDGEGIWGRWNANGPGTARLFYEMDLGQNFDDFAQAMPGDFMKIFWSPEVGRAEHGHSVIFLGTERKEGMDYVRFWSSNIPTGYGERSVPRSKIVHAIFSRLDAPANLERSSTVPPVDKYLASLLSVRSSYQEAKAKCGM